MKERIGLLANNNKIIVNTDTRFEQILYRSKYNKKDGLIKKFCNYENIIFGSIDQKDIKIIFNSLNLYTKKMKLIFVPHEPTPKIIKKTPPGVPLAVDRHHNQHQVRRVPFGIRHSASRLPHQESPRQLAPMEVGVDDVPGLHHHPPRCAITA